MTPAGLCFYGVLLACLLLPPGLAAAELKAWTGGPAPGLVLKDMQGAAHNLGAYRGKVVVINFWATWCAPCREEMPSLNALKSSLEGRPVAFLAVNLAEGEGRVAEFLKQVPIDFPVLLDRDGQASKAWKARLLPATFILGMDGRVRYSTAGERDWTDEPARKAIASLLQESPKR